MATSAPRPRPRRRPSPARKGVRALGELMITFGVVVLLLVVYQLYWTNIQANRAQDSIKDNLRELWSASAGDGDGDGNGNGNGKKGKKDKRAIPGSAVGIMYIERLGENWEKPIVEGVSLDHLTQGVGHFPDSAQAGEVGNFAVAAHRATHGEPFAYLDQIQVGDQVVVETRDRWFVYEIEPVNDSGRPWKLVNPSNGSVVLPVPEQPEAEPTEKLITLVTCHPRWGSSSRLIVYGELEKSYPKSGPRPPELRFTNAN